ncbi:MAG: alpha/beta hydrolase [Anaerolineales bacterium]|nr:alpha/beta hydrolase [Anaerolineales bacterium]
MKKINRTILTALGAAVGTGASLWAIRKLQERFKQETETALRTLKTRSQVIETSAGPVEISIHGEGPPVLVVHGAAGGYDQGEVQSEEFTGVRYISVSRPGYLRTPLATGETPAAQADAMAAVLEALKIPQAAFIGTSMGGLVGLFFALRHPDRCSALVLISAVNAPIPGGLTHYTMLSPLLSTDFLPWALLHPEALMLIRPTLRKQIASNPDKINAINQLIQTVYPTSLRVSGMMNDAHQIVSLDEIPLEAIRVPTLVIHGTADEVVPFDQGVRSAARIPDAQFLPVLEGTHYCVLTHLEMLRPAIIDFISKHPSITSQL